MFGIRMAVDSLVVSICDCCCSCSCDSESLQWVRDDARALAELVAGLFDGNNVFDGWNKNDNDDVDGWCDAFDSNGNLNWCDEFFGTALLISGIVLLFSVL